MPVLPPWANNHDVTHLQAMAVPMNLIWSESTQWLRRSGVKIPGALSTPMGTPIIPPWANDHNAAHVRGGTVPMHYFRVNRPCDCAVPASTRFQEPLSRPWKHPLCLNGANNHNVAHLQAKTVPQNLKSDSAQWSLSSGARKIRETLITDSRTLYYAHGHAYVAPKGKWPQRCTSTDWYSSNELDLELIGQVVAELWAGRTGGC